MGREMRKLMMTERKEKNKSNGLNIHTSVHRNTIPNYSQQDAKFLIYLFLQALYMFQAVPPPIIRNT